MKKLLLVPNILQACWSTKLNATSLLRAAPTIAGRISSAGRQKRTFGSIRLTCREAAGTQTYCCVSTIQSQNASTNIYNRFQMKACRCSQLWFGGCMASFTACLNLIISTQVVCKMFRFPSHAQPARLHRQLEHRLFLPVIRAWSAASIPAVDDIKTGEQNVKVIYWK